MMCDWQVSIPTAETHPSINLSAAVAISLAVLFESGSIASQKFDASIKTNPELQLRPDKLTEEKFFERLLDVLGRIKFLNLQNPEHIIEDLRAIYHRTQLNQRELRIVFGVISNIQVALQKNAPSDHAAPQFQNVKKSC
jgi:tRNA/rRNA methyltransferase